MYVERRVRAGWRRHATQGSSKQRVLLMLINSVTSHCYNNQHSKHPDADHPEERHQKFRQKLRARWRPLSFMPAHGRKGCGALCENREEKGSSEFLASCTG